MQDFSRPAPCSFLQGSQHFHGTQRVSQPSATALEDWGVQVTIEVCGQLTQECHETSSNCNKICGQGIVGLLPVAQCLVSVPLFIFPYSLPGSMVQ